MDALKYILSLDSTWKCGQNYMNMCLTVRELTDNYTQSATSRQTAHHPEQTLTMCVNCCRSAQLSSAQLSSLRRETGDGRVYYKTLDMYMYMYHHYLLVIIAK